MQREREIFMKFNDLTLRKKVGAVVYDENKQCLVLRRNPIHTHFPQQVEGWGLITGSIDAGETPLHALHREVAEEIGLQVTDPNSITDLDHITTYYCPKYQHVVVIKWFYIQLSSSELKKIILEEHEWVDHQIVPYDTAYNMMCWDDLKAVLKKAYDSL